MSFSSLPMADNNMHRKVLIVDDSQSTRMLVRLFLKKEGNDVIEAPDGETAVELLKEQKDIDVIVTDINMPGLSGIDLIKIIRGVEDYRFSPVIVLTSPDCPENCEKAKSAGTTAWINKPFKPESLIRIINRISRNRPEKTKA